VSSPAVRGGVLLAVGVVLAGLNLRIAVASVPPVIDEIERDLDLSAAAAGLLTTLPVLCFGVLAPLAPILARRLSLERVLVAAAVTIVVGVLLRAAPATAALFVGTAAAGAGIAVANVAVPAVVKSRFAHATGLVMGLYAASLGAGAALAGGLTVPLRDALDGGWEAALAVWALPAALAAAVLAAAAVRSERETTFRDRGGRLRSLLRDPVAWHVTLYMGLQGAAFYAGLAWIPSILRESGFSAAEAGAALSLFAVGGIPASLVAPALAARLRDQRALAATLTLLEAAAVAGLLAAPRAAFAWVALFAVGQGGAIGLALTLMVLRAPDGRRAGELSGMAQTIGYVVAAAGPVALGVLRDASGGWDAPLAALLVLLLALLAVSLAAGRPRLVALPAEAAS
jgi:MFS transporter, CP family, cyanate transporter